jgi:dethiobiotin synthetase
MTYSMKSLFVTGTDTGVGKTVVTACLISVYKKYQIDVGVMKPIETGVDSKCSSSANSDALFLMEVAGSGDSLEEVSPIRLKPAASPYQAALLENRDLDVGAIVENFRELSTRHDCMLVEGIGGLMVPITKTYMVQDLVCDLGLPMIIVARNQVGTLNHTLLTLRSAKQKGITVCGVILNQTSPAEITEIERGQAEILQELSGVPVLGLCPYFESVDAHGIAPSAIKSFEQNINLQTLGFEIVKNADKVRRGN